MTDEYVLSWIRDANLEWYEHSNGGFKALNNGFLIYINSIAITISKDLKRIYILKPTRPMWKEKTMLECLFEEILSQVANQCLERSRDEYQENFRNELLKELIGLQ